MLVPDEETGARADRHGLRAKDSLAATGSGCFSPSRPAAWCGMRTVRALVADKYWQVCARWFAASRRECVEQMVRVVERLQELKREVDRERRTTRRC